MIEHRINASPAQMRKLMSGGAITLKPSNFDPSSRRMIMVRPNLSRRIGTAMRKNKGVRVMLNPDEDVMEETEGGKISLKSIGRSLKKGFKDVGRALTSKKAKKIYREIGKEALPIVKGIADASIDAGSTALATYMGNPALAPVISGTAKVGLDKGYSALGKEVGLNPNTPVPVINNAQDLEQVILKKAEQRIKKKTKGKVREASLNALANYSSPNPDLPFNPNPNPVNPNPDETNQDEIDALMMGRGMRIFRNKGLRVGGALQYSMKKYAITSNGMKSGDDRGVSVINPPSNIIQIGAPYQRLHSPAMSPFIAPSPQLDNKVINKSISGGSFLAAGSRRGAGFMAAG